MSISKAIIKLAESVDVNQKWRILHTTEKELQRDMSKVFMHQRDVYLDVLHEHRHRIDVLAESVFRRFKESDSDDINRLAMNAAEMATDEAMQEAVKRGIRIALDEAANVSLLSLRRRDHSLWTLSDRLTISPSAGRSWSGEWMTRLEIPSDAPCSRVWRNVRATRR
ncbi:hypothetical protein [Geomicrobium sp. JCM 19039]|uniref:hypothetical protein n=1 Tax=Geomicrobium sp. JCM 19039 TaxID=1460636 RepID=UPI0005A77BC5|nr:hypothetical protein [Geomicrobium sp. JCM 19039]